MALLNQGLGIATLASLLTIGGVFETLTMDKGQLSSVVLKKEDCLFNPFDNKDDFNNIINRTLLPNEASLVFTLLFPLVPLPLYYYSKGLTWAMVKQSVVSPPLNFILVSHVLGQSGSFATTEINKYFMVSPNSHFWKACNVTALECIETAFQNNISVLNMCKTDTKSNDYLNLLQNLHTVPNIQSALLGAGTIIFIMLVYCCQKYYMSLSFSIKLGMLAFFTCAVQFLLWNQYKNNNTSLGDILYSFIIGLLVQSAISVIIFQSQNKPSSRLSSNTTSHEAQIVTATTGLACLPLITLSNEETKPTGHFRIKTEE